LPLSHAELTAVLGMLGPAQVPAVAQALLARLQPRVAHRLLEQVPGHQRRRSVHSSGMVLHHHARDRELYAFQRLMQAVGALRQAGWLPYELAHGVSRQPDGGYRLTLDAAPRLLELAAWKRWPGCRPSRRGTAAGATAGCWPWPM
jgi:hypothetical protein